MKKICFFILILWMFSACKKAEDRTCIKSRGEEVEQLYTLNQIEKLRLGRGIHFTLQQDTINQLKIKTGRNLINFIDIIEKNNELHITNSNTCNFLRYGKNNVNVEIHFTDLRNIYFEGSEKLRSNGSIQLQYLGIIVEESSSEIELDVVLDTLRFLCPYAWPQVKLHGSSNVSSIEIDGDAQLDFTNFQVNDEFNLAYTSSQYSIINLDSTNTFKGQIFGNGHVGHYGIPNNFFVQYYNSGRFLPL